MAGLLALLTTFPTVIFAGLALMCLAYWSLVLVGAADIDSLDSVAGHGHGGVEGVAASVKGLAGAVKGVAGAAKGGGSVVGEALAFLGLSRVPVTVTATAFSLMGFLLSAVTRAALDPLLPDVLSALFALGAGTAGGVGAMSLAARALSPLFADGPVEQGGDSLIGKTCRITITTDDHGGQARVDDSVIVSVRAVALQLAEGEEAVITERGADGVFFVEPLRSHLLDDADAFERLVASSTVPPAPQAAPEASSDAAVATAGPRKDNA